MSSLRNVIGWAALAMAVLVGGCDDATEIIVVVDSDLQIGVDFDKVDFVTFTVNLNRFPSGVGQQVAEGYVLPATLGLVPLEGGPQLFDIMVVASRTFDPAGTSDGAIVRRRVSNIPFVSGERRAVFIPLLRECLCNGTNCSSDPPCNDIKTPELLEFDEDNIPHLPR